MDILKCQNCGSNEFHSDNGKYICVYCGSQYIKKGENIDVAPPAIQLGNDVARLLEKCENEPSKAKKYANLILDIDPDNKECLKYL